MKTLNINIYFSFYNSLTNHVKHEVPYQKAQCHSTAKYESSSWNDKSGIVRWLQNREEPNSNDQQIKIPCMPIKRKRESKMRKTLYI